MFERYSRFVFFVVVLVAPVAERAAGAEEPEAALTLFQEGRQLGARGDYEGACAKFAASLALHPKLGTKLNLGDCSEHLGRTATARAHFLEGAAMARQEGDTARAEYATGRADALVGRIPHVVLRGLPRSREVRLLVDGVAATVEGTEVEVSLDPGDHMLAIDAPAREPWSRKVHVEGGAPPLVLDVPAEPAPPIGAERQRVSKESDAPAPHAPTRTPWPRIAALGVAGLGVAALGIGTFYGLQASSQWSDAKANCPKFPVCTPTGVNDKAEASNSALGSTVSFGVGFAALAGATVLALWSMAPVNDAPTPRALAATPIVSDHTAGFLVQGAFE